MPQITAALDEGLVVTLSNGRHEWTADEPVEAGGSDTAPNPYELLLGSLAACTCVTLAMYCRHKGLPLRSISTRYNYERVHADDCEDCESTDTGLIEKISGSVDIEGDFDDAQKKRLEQIVSRCPVHKTLAHGVKFDDKTTFSPG